MKRTLYDVIGVTREAPEAVIRAAIKAKADQYRNSAPEPYEVALLQQAVDVLLDEARRAAYDSSLERARQPNPVETIRQSKKRDSVGQSDEHWKLVAVCVCASILIGLQWRSCSSTKDPHLVTAEQFGDRWPLTVSHGRVSCERGDSLIFEAPDGTKYGINGMAITIGYPNIRPIWKGALDGFHPITQRPRAMSLTPIWELAESFCN